MKLDIYRKWFSDNSTIGELFVNQQFFCYTLEDTCRQMLGKPVKEWKVYAKTAIPAGSYPVIIDFSSRFKVEMPHVLDVEGFSGIRIHPGNSAKDTEGCILVGASRSTDFVGMSRNTYEKLMDRLEAAYNRGEPITLNIHGIRAEPAGVPQQEKLA
jgi:hypothetical protein